MEKKPNIVILGGGFVGLMVARTLARAGVVGKSCEVTVIDKAAAHVYTPWLYEVSTGYLSRDDGRKKRCKLYTSASVPFKGIPGYKHVRFRQETVTKVDFQSKTVYLADGLTVSYDMLVIGLGSVPNFFGIPGFPENCVPLKTDSDAMEIDRRVREVIADASPEARKHISIIGAGATGVEFTGELMMAIHTLEERGEVLPGSVSVTLIDRNGPLAAFHKKMAHLATVRLKKIGVHLLSGMSVIEATTKALVLKDTDGNQTTHPSDLTVWSGGVMPTALVKTLNLPMDPKGRLMVDPPFTVTGMPNVYAAGDCAALYNPLSGEMEPMSAQSSCEQGKWIAKNILRKLRGLEAMPFPFRKHWDVLIAVGGKYGVGHVFGVVLSGPIAFYLRRITDGRYFSWILPAVTAFHKWAKGVILYNGND